MTLRRYAMIIGGVAVCAVLGVIANRELIDGNLANTLIAFVLGGFGGAGAVAARK